MQHDAPEQLPAEIERGDSQPWLDMLAESERQFSAWQASADMIDRLYSELERWRGVERDREFALFWANIQIMAPSIYSRPPVPVVTPKFKDRRPVYRVASEFLERACSVAFDLTDIDAAMMHMRDDVMLSGRGVSWVRYEAGVAERVCVEYIDRKDFRHDPTARTWEEVQWVARGAWLDDDELKERFGEAARDLTKAVGRGIAAKKTQVWEVWSRPHKRVVWVAEGCQKTLDEGDPHLKLKGFFPCPRPAYATLQRRSLIPVPDVVFYKDQLEEINDLTRRIHALSWAIKVRGFYAGGGDLGDAIDRAIRLTDDEQLLIPVPALQSLMQGGGDPIMWLPIEMIAQTITGLIELRRQIIDDVYQVVGIADIMRGASEASETLGAQRMKQQNGSVRLRDKQNELIRVARDLVRIVAEVMAEEFAPDTLVDMAQMDIPTRSGIKERIKGVEEQARAAMEAQVSAMAMQARQSTQGGQIDPGALRQQVGQIQSQIEGQARAQIEKLAGTPAIEDVTEFLSDQKLRPFVLDIETDSTVFPDEMAEKASRTEFLAAFTGAVGAIMPLLQAGEAGAVMAGGMIKFALAPFRVGRELEGMIDDFVDQAPQMARAAADAAKDGQSEALAQANLKLAEAEMQKAQAATQKVEADAKMRAFELQQKQELAEAEARKDAQRFDLEIADTRGRLAETDARIEKIMAEIRKLGVDASNQTRAQDREDARLVTDVAARQKDQAMAEAGAARGAMERDREFSAGQETAKGRGNGR